MNAYPPSKNTIRKATLQNLKGLKLNPILYAGLVWRKIFIWKLNRIFLPVTCYVFLRKMRRRSWDENLDYLLRTTQKGCDLILMTSPLTGNDALTPKNTDGILYVGFLWCSCEVRVILSHCLLKKSVTIRVIYFQRTVIYLFSIFWFDEDQRSNFVGVYLNLLKQQKFQNIFTYF